jgi:hypothetical protein
MKIFYVIGFLLLFVFRVDSEYDHDPDNLIYLCRKVIKLYTRQVKNGNITQPFLRLHIYLKEIVVKSYQEDPVALFNTIRESGDQQVACFIMAILTVRSSNLVIGDTKFYSQIHLPNFFFERAKALMQKVCTKHEWKRVLWQKVCIIHEWKKAKEILEILLSIQNQFLHQFKCENDTIVKAKGWITEYESICHTFDPSDFDTLSKLFHDIHAMAPSFLGENPKKHFSILRLLIRFKIIREQFYRYHWEKLDFELCHPKLTCLIVINHSKLAMFDLLRNVNPVYSSDLFRYNKEIQGIKAAYEEQTNKESSIDGGLRISNEFYKSLLGGFENDKKFCTMNDRQRWLLKAIRHLLPILADYKRIF